MGAEINPSHPEGERLQKVLAAAGVASRRVCEQLISSGRVQVNGKPVAALGRRVNSQRDRILIDGEPVAVAPEEHYVILNKPPGVICSVQDNRGRPDLQPFLRPYRSLGLRLFHVGRLDAETGGLLLLTNSGHMAQVLSHPKFGVQKTYLTQVRGRVRPAALQQLRQGVELADGFMRVDSVRRLDTRLGGSTAVGVAGSSLLEITIHSGRNRIVRRLLEEVGHPVISLYRTAFGPLRLRSLAEGHIRAASREETSGLLKIWEQAGESRGS